MKINKIVFAILIGSMFFLTGCVFHLGAGDILDQQTETLKGKNSSFVYGYIDMKNTDVELEYVLLSQIAPKTDDPDHWTRVQDGIFYLENVPPGTYRLVRFGGVEVGMFCGGSLFCRDPHNYYFNDNSQNINVTIKKSGVYYMGAYEYTLVDSGSIFIPDTFKLVKIAKPTEKESLKIILPNTQKTDWANTLQSYI